MTDDYLRLRDRVDAFATGVFARRAADVLCGPGCSACCEAHLSVSAIEALAVAEQLDSLPADRRAELARRSTREEEGDPRCVMLDDDGLCAIYPARPLVCRTQGLPLLYPPGFVPAEAVLGRTPKGEITACPLNFTERAPASEDVLDMGRVDTLLALMGRLAVPRSTSAEESGTEDARFPLAALARGDRPFR